MRIDFFIKSCLLLRDIIWPYRANVTSCFILPLTTDYFILLTHECIIAIINDNEINSFYTEARKMAVWDINLLKLGMIAA